MDLVSNLLLGFLMGFVNLLLLPYHLYTWATLPTLKAKMNALLLVGMSAELFFVLMAATLILIGLGFWRRAVLRKTVLGFELFNGRIGQFAAWFALLMMLQQVLIIAIGQIFRGNEVFFAPFGITLIEEELQWLSGQLKFYNAILIAMASAYTFVEGGHVRVDLFYSTLSAQRKRWMDLIGTVFFFIPSTVLLWWFAWPIAVNSTLKARPMNIWSEKSSWRGFKFESSGTAEFTWVWSFKVLILVFAALMFIAAIGFLLRNILALLEPEDDIQAHYSLSGGGEEPAPATQ